MYSRRHPNNRCSHCWNNMIRFLIHIQVQITTFCLPHQHLMILYEAFLQHMQYHHHHLTHLLLIQGLQAKLFQTISAQKWQHSEWTCRLFQIINDKSVVKTRNTTWPDPMTLIGVKRPRGTLIKCFFQIKEG